MKTERECKAWLLSLNNRKLAFHPEDIVSEIVWTDVIPDVVEQEGMQELMDECLEIMGIDAIFDFYKVVDKDYNPEGDLSEMFTLWLDRQGLPQDSADDVLCRDDLTQYEEDYLRAFITMWESV